MMAISTSASRRPHEQAPALVQVKASLVRVRHPTARKGKHGAGRWRAPRGQVISSAWPLRHTMDPSPSHSVYKPLLLVHRSLSSITCSNSLSNKSHNSLIHRTCPSSERSATYVPVYRDTCPLSTCPSLRSSTFALFVIRTRPLTPSAMSIMPPASVPALAPACPSPPTTPIRASLAPTAEWAAAQCKAATTILHL